MPLVGSFIMPHGALALTKTDPAVPPSAHKLHDACMDAAKQINDLHPDYIFLTTPHGVSLSSDYVIYGNAKASGMKAPSSYCHYPYHHQQHYLHNHNHHHNIPSYITTITLSLYDHITPQHHYFIVPPSYQSSF